MKLKTFKHGGVHPPQNKLSAHVPIMKLGLPKEVNMPLSQHQGAPAVPIVKKGDIVKTGTLIARGEAFISANIHSPVSGTVQKIDDIVDASGYRTPTIVIKVEDDLWEESIDRSEKLITDIPLEPAAIVEKIKEMGIVGLGGATFPTHIKYIPVSDRKSDTLIVNGIECEPYLTSDHRLMLERPDEILQGIRIMMKAGKIDRAIIGIEANKPDAIAMMQSKIKTGEFPGIEVASLEVKYPQGAEKQLVKALLNREIPSGKLPLDVHCIVNNIGTALAIYEAVQKNKPLFERVVTITGKHLKQTGNFLVRMGTPVKMLLEALGEEIPGNTAKIISGGPMMGKALNSLDIPITKGFSGVVLIPGDEAGRREPVNCIRCAKCVAVCPMFLEPYLLEKLAKKEEFETCEKEAIMDCIECGSCSYICPSALPLLDYIRYGKVNVMRIMKERRQ
ncbi:MAG: electron transport complex subunit RsxC [Acidobacteria bacterium]|jgi:electron transport complex protein RnfC|nr:electron transport complex subunit RsxC [Acidobacteriota bacterium]